MNRQPNSIRAKKSLGQNFLVDRDIIDSIIAAVNPQSGETVFEIGAGHGELTIELLRRAAKVIAIEIDRDLIPILGERFHENENFRLIETSALKTDYAALASLQGEPRKTKLVGNLPYYLSTAILQHISDFRYAFSEIVVMVQKEVGERITAEAGKSERGYLTVILEACFETRVLFDVPPEAFEPQPKVTSSVIKMVPRSNSLIDKEKESLFGNLVSISFGQKRKTIRNNLKNAGEELKFRIESAGGIDAVLENSEVDPRKRAEALTIEDWSKMVDALYSQ